MFPEKNVFPKKRIDETEDMYFFRLLFEAFDRDFNGSVYLTTNEEKKDK
jgi:hypothetical protein